MHFLQDKKDYTTVATALLAELKALGITPPSKKVMLEALAKSMGHVSAKDLVAAPLPDWLRSTDEELAHWADELREYQAYRLSNAKGHLDLCGKDAHPDVAFGLTLGAMQGTLEDIPGCLASTNGARRKGGRLQPEYGGDTNVNWNSQEPRKDPRGLDIWVADRGDLVPADMLVLLPQEFSDCYVDFTDEERLEDFDELPVRAVLVETCARWLLDNNLAAEALTELEVDDDGKFGEEFGDVAIKVQAPGKGSTIGSAQWVAGFAMHVAEFKALRTRLLSTV